MMARIFGIDLRTLALFRVALALVTLYNLANFLPWAPDFLTDQGILTRAAAMALNNPYRISFHLANGQPWFIYGLFAVHAVLALALLVGYRTRLATMLLFAFAVSLVNRNQMITQGGDDLLLLLTFWSIFLPLGARFSIDAALAVETPEPAGPPAPPNLYFSVASMAILLQAAYVYVIGALLKDSPIWMPEGLAVYYAVSIDSYSTIFGHWLRGQVGLTHILTYFVWTLELTMPVWMFTPVWRLPLRMTAWVLLVAMHLGFVVFLTVGFFPAVSITSLLLFLPSELWDWLERRVYPAGKRAITLYYDRDCGFCEKTCRLFRSFCLTRDNRILAAQDDPAIGPLLEAENSWVVTDAAGNRRLKWRAVAFVLKQNPATWPLGALFDLPGFRQLGDWLYVRIGNNRPALGRLTARWLPYRPLWRRPGPLQNALIGALMVFVLFWNLMGLPKVQYKMPALLDHFARATQLDQHWNMFAPFPLDNDGYAVVRGEFTDGSPIDLWSGAIGEPDPSPPALQSDWYPDFRWRKYMSHIYSEAYQPQLYNYARYLCRYHNTYHPRGAKLETIRIDLYRAHTRPPGEPKQRSVARLLNWNCLAK